MKIAILGDLHFGVRKNNEDYLNGQLRFFRKQFIPYLRKNKIDTIIQLGDFFDNRKNMNIKVFNEVYKLLEEMKEFKMYCLIGNHDLYYNSNTETNSLISFSKFNNINIIDTIQTISFDDVNITLVPWITDHNTFFKQIKQVKDSNICCGHFELSGFKMNTKTISEEGIDTDDAQFFNKFKLILSGHYHTMSEQYRNQCLVKYVGSAFQLDRSDIGDLRGFHIYDVSKNDLKFIENVESIKLVKVKYPEIVDKKDIEGNVIDVEIEIDESYDEDVCYNYIIDIEKLNPLTVNPFYINKKILSDDEIEFELTSLMDMMQEFIKKIVDIDDNIKKRIHDKIKKLHEECEGDIK